MNLKDKGLFKQKNYINGNWVDANSKDSFDVVNPSDQKIIGTMPNSSKEDTIEAINSANNSWSSWKSLTGKERSGYIRKWHHLILENI